MQTPGQLQEEKAHQHTSRSPSEAPEQNRKTEAFSGPALCGGLLPPNPFVPPLSVIAFLLSSSTNLRGSMALLLGLGYSSIL